MVTIFCILSCMLSHNHLTLFQLGFVTWYSVYSVTNKQTNISAQSFLDEPKDNILFIIQQCIDPSFFRYILYFNTHVFCLICHLRSASFWKDTFFSVFEVIILNDDVLMFAMSYNSIIIRHSINFDKKFVKLIARIECQC